MAMMLQPRNLLVQSLIVVALVALHSMPASAFTETMIHAFPDDGTDGYEPNAALIYANHNLYGKTTYGGGSGYCAGGCGTIFAIDPPTGTETILSSFDSVFKSFWPSASLVKVNKLTAAARRCAAAAALNNAFQ